MSTFYLIDHSLKNSCGHHFDYAFQVLSEAERASYEVVLATNRRFRERARLPASWQVCSPFRHHTYCEFTVLEGWNGGEIGSDGRILDRSIQTSWLDRSSWFNPGLRRRQQRLRRFEQSCLTIFRRWPLQTGDQVFVPTLSEFDLVGLVRFLESTPETLHADWHLQFHFNLFEGRDPGFEQQAETRDQLKRQFESALNRVPNHRLHFYTTTSILARQYNHLRVANFTTLPYPIGDELAQLADSPVKHPLRLTCAGAVRAEKGQQFLSALLNDLWEDGFEAGQVQLAMQCKPKRWCNRPRKLKDLGSNQITSPRFDSPGTDSHAPLIFVRHPLSQADYLRLIGNSAIGLLLYDADRYYSRHAGVLGEYLSAGVPVIVPGGCWLADQISPLTQLYLQDLHDNQPSSAYHCVREMRTGDCFELPADPGDCLISLNLAGSLPVGSYLRTQAEQLGADDQLLATSSWLLSGDGASCRWLCRLQSDAVQLRVTIENAYHHHPLPAGEIRLTHMPQKADGGSHPAGCVGLIASSTKQVPDLVREMLEHYDHYCKTAREFSHQWHDRHRPVRTLESLILQSCGGQREKRFADNPPP